MMLATGKGETLLADPDAGDAPLPTCDLGSVKRYHGVVSLSTPPAPPAPAPVHASGTIASPRETVTLRQATAADAPALALVGAATFLEAFTWMLPGPDIVAHCARHHTPAAYEHALAQPDTHIVLATAGLDAPVGYAMLAAPDLPTFAVAPSDLELKRIYLFSRFRSAATPVLGPAGVPVAGLRAGQALLDAAVALALGMGRTRLLLGTHAGNLPAIAFYRRNGFAEVGTRRFQVGAQVCSDLIFGKTLAGKDSFAETQAIP